MRQIFNESSSVNGFGVSVNTIFACSFFFNIEPGTVVPKIMPKHTMFTMSITFDKNKINNYFKNYIFEVIGLRYNYY